jgi:hypothetical protein
MQARILALAAQAGLAFLAWWMMQTDDERRMIQANAWRELETLAMKLAKNASNVAAYAERKSKEGAMV